MKNEHDEKPDSELEKEIVKVDPTLNEKKTLTFEDLRKVLAGETEERNSKSLLFVKEDCLASPSTPTGFA